MNIVQQMKPKTATEKRTRTVVDTVVITPELLEKWISPPFQRPVRENDKVRALAEQLKMDGGVLPGVMTLGVFEGDIYIIDGQHRKAAFLLSGLKEGYTDVRKHFFESMAEMGDEFVLLNSQLVRMRPDDILRGLEGSNPLLLKLREICPFVGYGQINRNSTIAPIISMSALLRNWNAGKCATPSLSSQGLSTGNLATSLNEEDVRHISEVLTMAYETFGREVDNARLWGSLNIVLIMWMYNNMVLKQYSYKVPKMTKEMFKKCLFSLAADQDYNDWLLGRKLGERDRSPCYARIKAIFARRIQQENGQKAMLPAPPWQHSEAHSGTKYARSKA